MKNTLFIIAPAFLIFNTVAFSQDASQIQYIKDEYKKVSDRYINKDDPLVAISESRGPLWNILGIPRSRTIFYWESYRPDGSRPESDENTGIRLRKTESYHGGAGEDDYAIAYSEFLFDADGKVLFCYLKQGTGNLSRLFKTKWEKEERYYFRDEKLVRIIKDGNIDDNPGGKIIKKGKEIIERGKILKIISHNINSNWPQQIQSE